MFWKAHSKAGSVSLQRSVPRATAEAPRAGRQLWLRGALAADEASGDADGLPASSRQDRLFGKLP